MGNPDELASCLRTSQESTLLEVLVSPKASRNAVVGIHDGRLKIQIQSPPVDGAANDTLVRFVAKQLGISRQSVQLVAGQTSRRKTLAIDLERAELERRLGELL